MVIVAAKRAHARKGARMNLLIIEDDQRLARMLRRILKDEHYTVNESGDGLEGESLACTGTYDLIILDLRLRGRDGITVCRKSGVLESAHRS
jgi:DNA-binding response OmpR family regulator